MAIIKRQKNSTAPEVTAKYYLSNSQILPEVLKSKASGKITEKLAKQLMMLTQKYASKPSFSGYTYIDDMVSEALADLCKNALKFNPEKSDNPFAFYTTCIHNSFLGYLNVEKKHRKIRDQMLIEIGENPSFNFQAEYQQNVQGEYREELTDLSSEIAEAKERKIKDDAEAAALAAIKAAEAAEAKAASLVTFDDEE